MRPPQAFRSVAVLLGCVLLLSGCGSTVATGSNRNSPTGWGMVTVIAIGDSITTADSTDFDAGRIGPGSWAAYAGGGGVQIIGGWAHAGATTSDILAGLADTGTRTQADVLVLMAGNNDVDAGSAPEQIEQGLVQIVRAVHVDRVILSTLAPEDTAGAEVQQVNALLPALAREHGWQLIDPMTQIRDPQGGYLPDMSADGVHPTQPAARLIGQSIHEALITPSPGNRPPDE